MRRRQRKKLHLGEFQARGFRVQGTFSARTSGERIDELTDGIIEVVASRGMVCGGATSPGDLSFYFERMPRSCSEADRVAIGAWFRSQPDFVTLDVGELQDMYYMDGPRRR